MNIGMTALQDQLRSSGKAHAAAAGSHSKSPLQSQALLARLFITDPFVAGRGGAAPCTYFRPDTAGIADTPDRLTRILGTIDRYAAMISPRKSRAGRSATDSVRAIVGQEVGRTTR